VGSDTLYLYVAPGGKPYYRLPKKKILPLGIEPAGPVIVAARPQYPRLFVLVKSHHSADYLATAQLFDAAQLSGCPYALQTLEDTEAERLFPSEMDVYRRKRKLLEDADRSRQSYELETEPKPEPLMAVKEAHTILLFREHYWGWHTPETYPNLHTALLTEGGLEAFFTERTPKRLIVKIHEQTAIRTAELFFAKLRALDYTDYDFEPLTPEELNLLEQTAKP
jgi:hypothetical protein